MKKLLKVKVFGAVQGVFFRHTAKIKADELGLSGFVRNEGDSSVYAEAEGKERALNEFLEWCRRGPPAAAVEKIEFSFNEPSSSGETSGKFLGFGIK